MTYDEDCAKLEMISEDKFAPISEPSKEYYLKDKRCMITKYASDEDYKDIHNCNSTVYLEYMEDQNATYR